MPATTEKEQGGPTTTGTARLRNHKEVNEMTPKTPTIFDDDGDKRRTQAEPATEPHCCSGLPYSAAVLNEELSALSTPWILAEFEQEIATKGLNAVARREAEACLATLAQDGPTLDGVAWALGSFPGRDLARQVERHLRSWLPVIHPDSRIICIPFRGRWHALIVSVSKEELSG